MPIPITAADFDLVLDLARPVAPDRRSDFVAAVVERLAEASALGPGVVHRAAAEIQPQFVPPIDDPRVGSAASRRTAPDHEPQAQMARSPRRT
jgi:hypothetical protein